MPRGGRWAAWERRVSLLLVLAAAIGACSDGAGNSLSTGIGGTVRAEYGRVSR